jgi:serine/threonine protein kinase
MEVLTLKKLKHPNIIKYIEHIEEDDYILLVTELHGTSWDLGNPELNLRMNPQLKLYNPAKFQPPTPNSRKKTSCDLFECIDARNLINIDKDISEEIIKRIFGQVVSAVEYMNEVGMVHRDIKDENIVIDSHYKLKLIDFGSSSDIPKSQEKYFTKFNGTAHFAPPEVVKGGVYRGPEAEIWFFD